MLGLVLLYIERRFVMPAEGETPNLLIGKLNGLILTISC